MGMIAFLWEVGSRWPPSSLSTTANSVTVVRSGFSVIKDFPQREFPQRELQLENDPC